MKIYEYVLRIKDQASDKAKKIANAFTSARKPIDKFSEGMKDAGNSAGIFSGVASTLLRYIGPAALGAALVAGAMNSSKLARSFEQTNIAFEVMLGNADQARGMLGQLTELANVTPFTRTEVQDSAKLLLNFGVSAKKILPTVKMLGDISGGNAYKLHLMTLAFSQMSAAGRLMGQDLLQMVNAGFNPLQEISRKTGISIGVLKKKMEDGAISAKMVEEAFKSATSAGGRFFGMMERQSQTFEGRLSTLRDKMEIFSSQVGQRINEILSPYLDKAIDLIDTIIDKTGKFTRDAEKQKEVFSNLYNNLKPAIARYEEIHQKAN
jgi:tape measure domain-containing protein